MTNFKFDYSMINGLSFSNLVNAGGYEIRIQQHSFCIYQIFSLKLHFYLHSSFPRGSEYPSHIRVKSRYASIRRKPVIQVQVLTAIALTPKVPQMDHRIKYLIYVLSTLYFFKLVTKQSFPKLLFYERFSV